MSCDLKYCSTLIELISRSKHKINKKEIIKILKCEKCINSAFHELTVNLLNGNITLTQQQRKQLKSMKSLIAKLAKSKVKTSKKVGAKEFQKYCKLFDILKPSLADILDNV